MHGAHRRWAKRTRRRTQLSDVTLHVTGPSALLVTLQQRSVRPQRRWRERESEREELRFGRGWHPNSRGWPCLRHTQQRVLHAPADPPGTTGKSERTWPGGPPFCMGRPRADAGAWSRPMWLTPPSYAGASLRSSSEAQPSKSVLSPEARTSCYNIHTPPRPPPDSACRSERGDVRRGFPCDRSVDATQASQPGEVCCCLSSVRATRAVRGAQHTSMI